MNFKAKVTIIFQKIYREAVKNYLKVVSIKDEDHYNLSCFLKNLGIDPSKSHGAIDSKDEENCESIINELEKKLEIKYSN